VIASSSPDIFQAIHRVWVMPADALNPDFAAVLGYLLGMRHKLAIVTHAGHLSITSFSLNLTSLAIVRTYKISQQAADSAGG